MHILLSVLHTFLMVLVRRICTNVKNLMFGDYFHYSYDLTD